MTRLLALSQSSSVSPVEHTEEGEEGGGGWRGAKSFYRVKAWPSINYKLSG
jgi:hypothetical protein